MEFNKILQKSKGFANVLTDIYLDQLVDKIVSIREEYPNLLIYDKPLETIQSAHLKVKETLQQIHDLLHKHYEEYENKENLLNIPFDESSTPFYKHTNDIDKMKESSKKIQQFHEKLSQLIPVYMNLKLQSDQSLNNENIEQDTPTNTTTTTTTTPPPITTTTTTTTATTTQSFENIHKAVNNLKRLLLANEKLDNSLQRISQYTSLLPNLSENSTIPILDEILSSNQCPSSSSSSSSTTTTTTTSSSSSSSLTPPPPPTTTTISSCSGDQRLSSLR
ncbi:unnamed protein product [Schistosoma spindalis]|nr:unnamed protein product [Schistosoma spindale]